MSERPSGGLTGFPTVGAACATAVGGRAADFARRRSNRFPSPGARLSVIATVFRFWWSSTYGVVFKLSTLQDDRTRRVQPRLTGTPTSEIETDRCRWIRTGRRLTRQVGDRSGGFRWCRSAILTWAFFSGNYSCFDGGGGCADNTFWMSYEALLDSVVALLSPSCSTGSAAFNHSYFHISHAIMFICYMLPFGSPCKLILLIRIGLAGATTVMALLAQSCQCWFVSLLWNAASAVVNFIYIFVLFYQLRPIKFNDELEQVTLD